MKQKEMDCIGSVLEERGWERIPDVSPDIRQYKQGDTTILVLANSMLERVVRLPPTCALLTPKCLSEVTLRRLRDAEEADKLPDPAPEDRSAWIRTREQLLSGICALQSTDDLGSPEANQACMDLYDRLWARLKKLDEQYKD